MLHGVSSRPNLTPIKTQLHHPPMNLTCLSSPLLSFPFSSLRPKRLHSFRPLSSLRETKKPTLRKASNVPQNLKFGNKKAGGGGEVGGEEESSGGELGGDTALKGTVLAGLLLLGVVGGFGAVGYIYKDQVNAFLTQFSGFIEGYGPAGYALFVAVYAGLELAGDASRDMGICECRCIWTSYHPRRIRGGITWRKWSTIDLRPWPISYSLGSSLCDAACKGCCERYRLEPTSFVQVSGTSIMPMIQNVTLKG
ncbi:uncharacterized protein A4U43_C10F11500 [Asparagus officinalis]|uniref:Uncharacterized protein n=1 Tax=Asparagus officinalis TaxID=4686 RepID=A0A5P1E5E8_ASPOF|nr:uncharacterized protein LOC109825113 [Asparagus officinalis]ONK56675.1 uncharacterized protein A4U43_C10F11500 [Asparagus officinalis]